MDGAAAVKRVVGIKYRPGEGLPEVVLKGSGGLAQRILEERNAHKRLPVVRDPDLLDKLYRLPTDARIGPELFHLVALLLAHVFSIEAEMRRNES